MLASAEKLNVASSYTVMALEEASGVVLDADAPEPFVASMRRAGLDVHRDRS